MRLAASPALYRTSQRKYPMRIANSRVKPLSFTAAASADASGPGEIVPLRKGSDAIVAAERVLLEQALVRAEEAERRLAEAHDRVARLEAMLQTDELTGLSNRRG